MTEVTAQRIESKKNQRLAEKSTRRHYWTPLSHSFVWILLALFCVEVFLYTARPLKFVHVQGTMLKDHDVVGIRVNQILFNSKKNNCIVLGDSTADSICVYPDMAIYKIPLNTFSCHFYTEAKAGESILNKALELQMTLKNLSFGGCLVSDQALICQKLIEHGGTPKVAFVTLVPRPFIDTTVIENISPVKCYFDHRIKRFDKVKNFSDLFDYGLSSVSNIYRTRSDYATVLSSLACSTFKKPLNAYEQNNSRRQGIDQRNKVSLSKDEELLDPHKGAVKENIAKEIAHYKNAYKFDPAVFQYQLKNYNRMLSILKNQNVTVVLVKLPLHPTNLNLLKPEVLALFNQKIHQNASENNLPLIDFQQDPSFVDTDYVDSVHLNGPGSIKLWQKLADSIKNDPYLLAKIKENST